MLISKPSFLLIKRIDLTVATLLNGSGTGEMERDVQKSYWMEHSKDLTVEAMMLDSRASELDKEERPEVYSLSSLRCLWMFL